ncbi:MAG: DUF1353 domain-containing protein [Alphaproteobacteria bacterium]|nr:DUF1353 domain-containing protein [Alphaproteobacteria bacterium]
MRVIMAWITSSLILFPVIPSKADVYYGEFAPKNIRFQTIDGKSGLFEIITSYRYQDPNGFVWYVPAGEITDGASIPSYLWSIVGSPFSGDYLSAAVVHGYYCRTKERTAHATHRAFFNGMMAKGMSLWQAKLMYYAVVAFGPSWEIQQVPVRDLTGKVVGTVPERVDSEPIDEDILATIRLGGGNGKSFLMQLRDRLIESEGAKAPNICADCAMTDIDASLDNLQHLAEKTRLLAE